LFSATFLHDIIYVQNINVPFTSRCIK